MVYFCFFFFLQSLLTSPLNINGSSKINKGITGRMKGEKNKNATFNSVKIAIKKVVKT